MWQDQEMLQQSSESYKGRGAGEVNSSAQESWCNMDIVMFGEEKNRRKLHCFCQDFCIPALGVTQQCQ